MPKAPEAIAWETRTIEVRLDEKSRVNRAKVEALCSGPIAVHKSVNSTRRWVVSSIPIGLLVASFATEEEAKKVAEVLRKRCTAAFWQKTKEDLKDCLDPWVYPWLKKCYDEGKFTPPPV